jgi:flavin reductase (DIM6/NTAB) family NADH-FMN oxidoreductase RutF
MIAFRKRRIAVTASHSKRSLGPLPLLYPEPALLVSVWYEDGKPGVMTAAWGGICCSEPLCLTVAIRPVRRTHDALLARKAFTVGIPSEAMLVGTDYVGIVSGRRNDKFAVAGWTAVPAERVDAPYVAECPVVLECSLTRNLDLGSHTLIIGTVVDVKADEDCLDPTGAFPDIRKVAPLVFDAGSRAYYGIGGKLGDAFSVGKQLV